MKKNLPIIILVGVGLIIVAGGIIAVVLGQAWITIIYFGIGAAIALFVLIGQPLFEGCWDRDILWIFPCCVVYGAMALVVTFFLVIFCGSDTPHPAID